MLTFTAMAALALAVLWRSSPGYRLPLSAVVSAAAIMLAVKALSTRKLLWGVAFLSVLGAFTPFRSDHFSYALVTAFNMATLALFAISPIVLKESGTPSGLAAEGIVTSRS